MNQAYVDAKSLMMRIGMLFLIYPCACCYAAVNELFHFLPNHVSSVNCMTHISHILYNMDFHCYWNVQDEIDPILNF